MAWSDLYHFWVAASRTRLSLPTVSETGHVPAGGCSSNLGLCMETVINDGGPGPQAPGYAVNMRSEQKHIPAFQLLGFGDMHQLVYLF